MNYCTYIRLYQAFLLSNELERIYFTLHFLVQTRSLAAPPCCNNDALPFASSNPLLSLPLSLSRPGPMLSCRRSLLLLLSFFLSSPSFFFFTTFFFRAFWHLFVFPRRNRTEQFTQ